ncbi:MAG: transposase, partial [Candidatus Bipolaricaulia bacterium]
IQKLPPETRRCLEQHLEVLDEVQEQIDQLEARMKERIQVTEKMKLLKTLPGVGDILAIVIEREVGCIDRFPDNGRLASYCGTTPKVRASGGKVRHGRTRPDVNRYLKWAFIEAANVVVRHQNRRGWQQRHVTRLYKRIRSRRGPAIAVGAVARHLSEAAYWVLKKREPYREPKANTVLPKPR